MKKLGGSNSGLRRRRHATRPKARLGLTKKTAVSRRKAVCWMKLLEARLNNSGDLPKSHARFTNSIVKHSSKCGRSVKRRVTRRRQPGSPLNRHEKQPKRHVTPPLKPCAPPPIYSALTSNR